MRRYIALSLTLIIAGCAARPQQPVTVAPPPVQPQPPEAGSLTGLTTQELVGRFGSPALQIREGTSLKLQFRGRACVLDAYLYPSGGATGPLRVTHVDTRAPSGADYSQAACVTSLEYPS